MRVRRSYGRDSSGGFKKFLTMFLLFFIAGSAYYVYNSKTFERNLPTINLENEIFWNLKTPINLEIFDDTGIKSAKVSLSDGRQTINLLNENFELIRTSIPLEISLPKGTLLDKNANYKLNVEVNDISRWNFLKGNNLVASVNVMVDTKKPDIYVVNQSYKITKGGAAVVVFKASDEMLKDVYLQTSFDKIFKVVPFYKDGYYASLVAWPVTEENFRVDVVAKDMAGNESKTRVRYYLQDKIYKKSEISLTDKFIDGKITDLVNEYAKNPDEYQGVDKFKYVNETLRGENEKLIHFATSKILEKNLDGFYIDKFYPLKNGAAVASYGDHRFYSKDDKPVSESWHLGLDLASTSQAEIQTSNDGVVVLAKNNGIYGVNIVIYHGLGLYSIYAHCSNTSVEVGNQVKSGDIIGKTGVSGLAFGDHLHFGINIQGIDVRPEEWMDPKWMKENIFQILDNSKSLIDNKK